MSLRPPAPFTWRGRTVIIGGLYWKKGTNRRRLGGDDCRRCLGVAGSSLQQVWKYIVPAMLRWFPDSSYLMQHQDKFRSTVSGCG